MDETRKEGGDLRSLERSDVINSFYWKLGWQENQGSRKQQQDRMGAVLGSFRGEPALIAILADGMGGMKDGAAFSAAAINYYYESFQDTLDRCQDPSMILLSLVYGANRAAHALFNPDKPGGTTLVSALFLDDKVYTLSVGDSRICFFRKTVRRTRYDPLALNREHVLGDTLDERAWLGHISFEDAEDNLFRDSLTSCLGPETIRHVDLQISPIVMQPEDKVVLMSDGVYRTLSESEIAESMGLLPQKAADDVVRRVLEKKAPHQDNMSIVVVGRGGIGKEEKE